MVVSPQTHPSGSAPGAFVAAVEAMRAARMRPEVLAEEMPAPQRIAPWATALSGDVTVDGEDIATGRIICLHDPAGHEAWDGTFRVVAYIRAEVEPELAADPMAGEVAWSWLTEALDSHGADYAMASGSVTRVATENFGGMLDDGATAQLEIRASWTPEIADLRIGVPDVRAHVEAWGDLLCQAAGLEPVPEGVVSIPSRRGQLGGR